MSHTLAGLDEERARLTDELSALAAKVPPQFGDWSWNRTQDFMQCHEAALKLAKKPKPPTAELTTMMTKLRGFWQ